MEKLTGTKEASVYVDLYNRKDERIVKGEKPDKVKQLPVNLFVLFISFVVPMFGFMIWILQREDYRHRSIFAGIGTLLGTIVLVAFNLLRLNAMID
jgi:RsiW-degrading membrane proteinase PrsW (M82 family)